MTYPRIVQLKRTYVVLPLGSSFIWMYKNWFDAALNRGVLILNEYNQFVPYDLNKFGIFSKLYYEYDKKVHDEDEREKVVTQLMFK